MVARAIVQNGGIFIPNAGNLLGVYHGQITVDITLIRPTEPEIDPFVNAAGILRGQSINPIQFEQEIRDEWNRAPFD